MNATLTALVADVFSMTNRPDLVNQTILAVKAATLKAHHSDFYPKDIFETGVVFDSAAYLQSLEYKLLIPRYRALKYMRKTDVLATDTGLLFTVVVPEQIVDAYNVNKDDIVYLAGSVLNIRSSTLLQYLFMGCYVHPDITDDGYDSWIYLDHPFAIVYEAVAMIFKSIGFDEQATMFQRIVAEQYAELKIDSVLAVGY